jgi:hypothetical protein
MTVAGQTRLLISLLAGLCITTNPTARLALWVKVGPPEPTLAASHPCGLWHGVMRPALHIWTGKGGPR